MPAPLGILGCSGCSMFNLMRFSLVDPADWRWAMLIVGGALAAPLLVFAAGFRLGKKRDVTPAATGSLTALLLLGWAVIVLSEPYSSNFAVLLLHWIYLPVVMQYNLLMAFAWFFPPLLALSALVIPAWLCYVAAKWLLEHDRHIVWRTATATATAPTPAADRAAAA